MKIFGFEFTTKRERELQQMFLETYNNWEAAEEELIERTKEFYQLREMFPLDLGQVVYDVVLKDAKGRFTKTAPSLEYSTVNLIEVDEQNYFGLVERMKRNDIFVDPEAAEAYLKSVCK